MVRCSISLVLALCAVLGSACHKGTPGSSGTEEVVPIGRRIDRLRELITLPATPTEAWFEQVPLGTPGGLGPTDYLLVAVMRFDRGDLARITATAQRRPGSPPRLSKAANRTWLPDPVKAAIRPHDDRSVAVRGDKFDATPFAKSPFLSGTFVAIEGGEYVIVVLQTS